MPQTYQVPAFPAADGDDALALALADPEVRASLAVIAANAPNIAMLITASQALLARSRDIVDNINGRVEVLRDSAPAGPVDFSRYRDLIGTVGDASPAIQEFLKSPVLAPEVVDVIGRVGEAALEADRVTRGRELSIGGIMALLRELRDPRVQETLSFLVAFARAFGRDQAVPAARGRA